MKKNYELMLGECRGKKVIFDRSKSTNGHTIVLGTSGAGKTTWIVKTMTALAKAGVTVVAFDTGDNFSKEKIHKEYRGDFLTYLNSIDVRKDGISIPLFTPLELSSGRTEMVFDVVEDITDAFCRAFNFKSLQRASLLTAVESMADYDGLYAEKGISALDELLNDIRTNKAYEVADRIAPITKHNVFRNGELFIEAGKINLIRLSDFSEKAQKLVVEIVSAILWKYASKGKFKENIYIVIDECQNLDMGKNGILSKILVEGRKYNYNLLLSTQVMSKNSHVSNLMTQAGLFLNFKPAKSESKYLASLIDKKRTDHWTIALNRLGIGEFVATGTLKYGEKIINDPILVSDYISEDEDKTSKGYEQMPKQD